MTQARSSPFKRSAVDPPATDAAPANSSISSSSSASSGKKQHCSGLKSAAAAANEAVSKPSMPSVMDIRAFGLEDRAEAVIAHGTSSGWSLANLAQWRQETFQDPSSGNAATKPAAYLKQRQRAYRQQMLSRGAASADSASPTT